MSVSSQTCYIGAEAATASCTMCGKPICAEHTKMGQPFISAGDLVKAAISTPSLLMAPPLGEVAYCPQCREALASRRTAEQLKILLGLLAIIAVIVLIVYMAAF